ncbi:HD domain-containing protein [Patescibacteria group bacterium]|nr:HD domain-containing protein [Patescibacteria group bacterium]MBU4367468.1 HD domain-containing protein [Patescibacteria group bacterium]MBU4461788.1 HD domain-containing protein [Patescibacteria group bacterium]
MLYGIKDPETSAEHTFRMTLVAWILGYLKNLNVEKIIKIALIHDLCEVYAGDITPYDGLLPKNKKERYEFVRKWPHLSENEKKERYLRKLEKEKKSLEKLTENLPPKIKKQILDFWWHDYEMGKTQEGRFTRQADKAENLIEAFDCWKRDKKFPTKPWWQHANEVIDDPLILKFLKEIEIKELRVKNTEHDPLMLNLLTFFSEAGKLKRIARKGWVLRGIKNPESIAEHTFRTVIMAWFLGEKRGGLNIEKLLKMALIHDLCEIYAGDTTPYDTILPKDKKKIKELMKTWPRFSDAEKKKIAAAKHKKEEAALNKLVNDLPKDLKQEIKNLWLDYEKSLTPEGRFFKQADRLENLLQALEYWKKYKNFPQKPWWLQASEFFDEPILLDFIKEMENKFHRKIKPKV